MCPLSKYHEALANIMSADSTITSQTSKMFEGGKAIGFPFSCCEQYLRLVQRQRYGRPGVHLDTSGLLLTSDYE
jgi:hypothetical protein